MRFKAAIRLAVGLAGFVAMAACGRGRTTTVGHFVIRTVTEEALGHSLTTVSLSYHGRLLVESAGAWAVQPDNPDRIVYGTFSYGDRTKPCGTYLFDGTTNESILMELEPASFSVGWRPGGRGSTSPWSSGGRFIILDSWLVLD